jgi:hypothetical protein
MVITEPGTKAVTDTMVSPGKGGRIFATGKLLHGSPVTFGPSLLVVHSAWVAHT